MEGAMAPGMLSSLCDMLKPPEDSDSDDDKVRSHYIILSLCLVLRNFTDIWWLSGFNEEPKPVIISGTGAQFDIPPAIEGKYVNLKSYM